MIRQEKLSKKQIQTAFEKLQDEICQSLETADEQGRFMEDRWQREGGGGGKTRIIQGKIIEKGGVNFSAVHGQLPSKIGNALQLPLESQFFATGVSIVLHPHNPHVPIIHMNVRYFEITTNQKGIAPKWGFGGGIDLTPHYVVEEDARYFHNELKAVCDKHDHDYYPKFKKWADDYFYLPHRNETRGIGGIFFDRLSGDEKMNLFEFVKSVGNAFAPIYTELMKKNSGKSFSEKEKDWQLHRRGRYVEFNLVWDKGTKFGLDTNGRTESILMSLPSTAKWTYNYEIEEKSPEENTLNLLKKGIDWAS
jgi:coproporphyrinogen III oxidase